MNMAEKLDVVKRPQSWDKAVSVAYLRLLSWSQEGAAKAAGIGVRTLRRYEISDWWPPGHQRHTILARAMPFSHGGLG